MRYGMAAMLQYSQEFNYAYFKRDGDDTGCVKTKAKLSRHNYCVNETKVTV